MDSQKKNSESGFTLVELLIYAVVFTVAAGLLTGILVSISGVQTKENAAFEVTRQLQFVTQRIQYAVRDSSIVDAVYEGSSPAVPCSSFCTVRLRVEDNTLDPTIISSDANGVYIQEGAGTRTPLTSTNIKVGSLKFSKTDNPGGLSTLTVDLALVFAADDAELQISKRLASAIAHVSAATFDTDLLPDSTDARSIGGSTLKWKDATFSNGITFAGPAGVGEQTILTAQRGTTHGSTTATEYYVTSTPYDKYGLRFNVGGTSMLYLEGDINQAGRRSYFLTGNVGVGTASPERKLTVSDTGSTNISAFRINTTGTDAFNWASSAINPNMTAGKNLISIIGQAESVKNSGYIGFNYQAAGSDNNFLTFGLFGADNLMNLTGAGNLGIGTTSPGSYRLNVAGGNAYFSGDVSALSFTDRTPYPKDKAQAYEAVMSMKRLPDGQYDENNKEVQLDHSTLTPFVKGNEGMRDLSATVSAQNEVIKDLVQRIEELEKRCDKK